MPTITVREGVVYTENAQPFLRFANTAVAANWLMRSGWTFIRHINGAFEFAVVAATAYFEPCKFTKAS